MFETSTLVSPVSTQVFPVVVTVLTLKPAKVVLLSTPQMKMYSEFIRRALNLHGIEVQEREINPYSFSSIKEVVKDIQNPIFLLNCGTKFTAISLYRISNGKNMFYYLPTGEIVDFNGNKIARVSENLIDVETHAKIYGFEIVEERQDIKRIRERKELTEKIASNDRIVLLLLTLFHKGFTRIFPEKLLKLAVKHNVLAYKGGKIVPLDREYVGGKWLEEFVFNRLIDLNFSDVRIGVKVKWYGENVFNEIDVMATKNNFLYLFSCKSGKNVKDILKHLYELEELTERIGGDFGRSYLVITKNLFKSHPPSRKEFPNAPKEGFFENKSRWYNYYKTPEGENYKRELSEYRRFVNLRKRAKLLKIKIITPQNFGGEVV
ncbi:protein of unknown function [Balnearium lithotrophicum]|uniref:Card1 endonuclease domain-containing protein n=1 Tax=Balnearium lithotrophicum TaxID=223788 RepID=A0A521DID8_9BACT|nr:DUF1887 family CARF protein [Balnearium lithotrophicum]SMO71342.1 protein of unknown function [Balnearium lithotrophicum]